MALQLVEAYIPSKYYEKIDKKLQSFDLVSQWVETHPHGRTLVRMLVENEKSEEILNYLESVANVVEGFEVILFPVQT